MDESDLNCPSCSKSGLERGIDELDVPHFGKVVHYYMRCPNCGFKVNDFAFQGDYPKEDQIEIRDKSDLNTKIVRGSSATITIPELGLELYPGPLSESFITNIEGLLNRFLTLLPLFDDQKKVEEVEKKIRDAVKGHLTFHVAMTDPSGVSHFIREE